MISFWRTEELPVCIRHLRAAPKEFFAIREIPYKNNVREKPARQRYFDNTISFIRIITKSIIKRTIFFLGK